MNNSTKRQIIREQVRETLNENIFTRIMKFFVGPGYDKIIAKYENDPEVIKSAEKAREALTHAKKSLDDFEKQTEGFLGKDLSDPNIARDVSKFLRTFKNDPRVAKLNEGM